MGKRLQQKFKIKFEKNPKISVGDSHLSYIQPDFYSKNHKIIGEIFVHIGEMKKAQSNKISNDIMKMLHIGRSAVYSLLQNGVIRTVKVGRKYIIPKQSVTDFINSGLY